MILAQLQGLQVEIMVRVVYTIFKKMNYDNNIDDSWRLHWLNDDDDDNANDDFYIYRKKCWSMKAFIK